MKEEATPVSNSATPAQTGAYDRPILQRRKPTPDELKAEEILIKLQKQNAGKNPIVR